MDIPTLRSEYFKRHGRRDFDEIQERINLLNKHLPGMKAEERERAMKVINYNRSLLTDPKNTYNPTVRRTVHARR
ncbi:MAG: hypothetical protein ABW115_22620 [Candidatus Thiodiazotropha sp. 6PLUC6]